MSAKHLSSCCLFTCLLLAIVGQSQADDVRSHDDNGAAPVQGPKHRKLAGRAGNDERFLTPAVQQVGFEQAKERKLLSADERRALRRLINETENRYPQKH